MLIAVATKDGKLINQHFGHAERFLIFDVDDGSAKLVDEKKTDKYCTYDPEHPLRRHVLEKIASALDGCSAIVSSKIGEAPQQEMERLGFSIFVAEGEIRPTLVELVKVL
ncbi:MAG TPA: NifB/NifX family molybdenum-iron cluster-binding protein [Geobacteraceae bacterium]|nr:NifB/NifX family molybdenum-iron cluster-binding protein [Geobacteraceae bacterium]